MLTFVDRAQKTLEESGREITLRVSINFPGYAMLYIYGGTASTGSTVTIGHTSGPTVLTEGTHYTASANNLLLAGSIAAYINSNVREVRAVVEAIGDKSATAPARLIIMATRKYTVTSVSASSGTGGWASSVESPTSGWSYNAVTGGDTIAGYSASIKSIGDFGETVSPIDRSCSVSKIDVILAMDEELRLAFSRFGVRDAPVDIYLLSRTRQQPGGVSSPPIWTKIYSYWVKDAVPVEQGAAMRLDLIGISEYLNERKVVIPSFLGRHPLQVMQLLLEQAGFAIGTDPRIDWTSFSPTRDPTRGHFNLTYYRDTANSLNVETVEEADRYIGLWDLLQELVMLTGGTLRLNAAGQLEHIPYDENAPAIETWDLNADTGFDGEPPEVEETEAFLTNKVNWDFAQAQGATQVNSYSEDQSADESRGAYFTLEDQDSIDVYGQEHDVGFSSRWLNGASYASHPYGATGYSFHSVGVIGYRKQSELGLPNATPSSSQRIIRGHGFYKEQRKRSNTFWYNNAANYANGLYGAMFPSTNAYIQYTGGGGFAPAGETDVSLMAWVVTDGSNDMQYVGQWNGVDDGWKFGQSGKRIRLTFRISGVESYVESDEILQQRSALPLINNNSAVFMVHMTYSSGSVQLYANGQSRATTVSGTIPTSWPTPQPLASHFRIGPGYSKNGAYKLTPQPVSYGIITTTFDYGDEHPLISNVAYWSQSLSSLQIQACSRSSTPHPNAQYPQRTYLGLNSVPTPDWWVKLYENTNPGIGTAGTVTESPDVIAPQGPYYGEDTRLCLHTAAINGFSGTRTNMGIAGFGNNTGGFPKNPETHGDAACAITPEDSVADLDDSAGRVAYLMFEPHSATLTDFPATGGFADTFSTDTPDRKLFHSEDELPSSQAVEAEYVDLGVPTWQAKPEIVKIDSYFMRDGHPVADDEQTPTVLKSITSSTSTTFAGSGDSHDHTRNYRLPRNIWASVDTSYNSEGFTRGRGGFGTFPPRIQEDASMDEDLNFQLGGWHLEGIPEFQRTRVVDATIPAYRSKEVLSRFKFGACRLSVRTPLSKMRFQIGDVISVLYGAFFSYGRIGLDSSMTFEIVGKKLSFSESDVSIEWDLVELKDSGQLGYVPTFDVSIFRPRPISPGTNPFGYAPVTDNALVDGSGDFDGDGVEDERVFTS